ncbi:Bax inhibitor-1/YccA family protein [Pseudovibrio brasiliensis]|uniref:Bax inhibitor-1/YccA family protein n=1 Tax=Pseudovibrio brasiliensis TaxID=1898042 RepID=A0ABX8AKJ2_9HYPH|nr:Bax inhibitor-1/YccA family protein [Pseudovibrio brasiliensis]QUS55610.1 Bax inhibitor-1/YccA family protein [Pseudovibrio brasiliensis]
MATFDRNNSTRYGMAGSHANAAAFDAGLRAYMLRVYNYMAIGIAITGVVAFAAFQMAVSNGALTEFGVLLFTSPLRWVVMLAPLGFVFFLSARIHKMSASGAQLAFWLFAGAMGLSLSSIFLVYTGNSIARVFFITAASFGALSLFGYTTKKDLSAWGSFLFMGLIGIIIASLVNLFLASSALQFAISVVGVLVFAGLTAYDTQQIKEMYAAVDDSEVAGKKAIMGALRLYLDFINLFIMLLSLFGNRE